MSQADNCPLPSMQKAMQRTLLELPWQDNGLGLTEQLSLEALAQEGTLCPGELFNLLMTELEPLPFLGDIMLVTILRNLWQGAQPAILCKEVKPKAHPMERYELSISEFGLELLQCKQHWLKAKNHSDRITRYVGGVKISNISKKDKNWYWSSVLNKPVLD